MEIVLIVIAALIGAVRLVKEVKKCDEWYIKLPFIEIKGKKIKE